MTKEFQVGSGRFFFKERSKMIEVAKTIKEEEFHEFI
jgi:hypothetical protein